MNAYVKHVQSLECKGYSKRNLRNQINNLLRTIWLGRGRGRLTTSLLLILPLRLIIIKDVVTAQPNILSSSF